MSSIDSTLNSASALITLDFVKPGRPDLSEKDTLKIGRISMAVIMLLAAFWAPQIANFEGLFKYLQEVLAYMVPPVTILFLMGVTWQGGTKESALATLIGGHLVSVFLFIGTKGLMGLPQFLPKIHFTLIAGIVFAASLLIYLLTSGWGQRRALDEISELMIQPAPAAQPGWKDYRLHSAILIALTGALVVAFY